MCMKKEQKKTLFVIFMKFLILIAQINILLCQNLENLICNYRIVYLEFLNFNN